MASLTDGALDDFLRKKKEVSQDLHDITDLVNGIIVIFSKNKDEAVNTSDVMKSTKKMYNQQFKNKAKGTVISIKQLQQSAAHNKTKIEQLSEPVTDDLMKYFKAECRRTGIQYSILKEKGEKKDNYYIFFKSSDATLIKGCIERGMKDYVKDMKNPHRSNPERPSMMQKLNRFIAFVKKRDAQAETKDKLHSKPDISK